MLAICVLNFESSLGMLVVEKRAATKEESGIGCYYDGHKTEAKKLLTEAVAEDIEQYGESRAPVAAAFRLGEMFRHGDGIIQDINQAIRYYQLALNSEKESFVVCNNEKNLAALELGKIYFYGLEGISQNLESGIRFLTIACRDESIYTNSALPEAAVVLGNYYYEHGNAEKAKTYYGSVLKKFNIYYMQHLGIKLKTPDTKCPIRFRELPSGYVISKEDFAIAAYRMCTLDLIEPTCNPVHRFENEGYYYCSLLAKSDIFDSVAKNSPLSFIKSDLLLKVALGIKLEDDLVDLKLKLGGLVLRSGINLDEDRKNREYLLRCATELKNKDAIIELAKHLFFCLKPTENSNTDEIKGYIAQARELGSDISSLRRMLESETEELKEALSEEEKSKMNGIERMEEHIKTKEDRLYVRLLTSQEKAIRIFQTFDILSSIDTCFSREKILWERNIFADKVWSDIINKRYSDAKSKAKTDRERDFLNWTVLNRYDQLNKRIRDEISSFNTSVWIAGAPFGIIRPTVKSNHSIFDYLLNNDDIAREVQTYFDEIQALKDNFDIN